MLLGLPWEARAGLMRAWLAILRERHPNVTWLPADRTALAVTLRLPIEPADLAP